MSKGKKHEPQGKQPTPTAVPTTPRKPTDYAQWVVLVVAFLVYAGTLGHGYVLDDPIITSKNAFVQRGIGGWWDIFTHGYLYGFNGMNDQSYRPLVLANMALEYQLFGFNAKVSHFFNVALFAVGCWLLYRVCRRALGAYPVWVALGISLLFAVHPIHSEVVANVKSRDEVLSFLLAMGSWWCVFRYLDTRRMSFLVGSACLFWACVLAKETGLAYLGSIPLLLYFFGGQSVGQVVRSMMPFVVVTVVYFLMRFSAMDNITFSENMDPINNSLMASSGAERLATQAYILGKYVWLLLFPHPLSYDYSYNQIPALTFANWQVWVAILTQVVLLGLGAWGVRHNALVAFGVGLYYILLVLVSNTVTYVGATMAERFIFGSSLGFCFVVVGLLAQSMRGATPARPVWVVAAIVLLALSSKTIARSSVWKSPETLFLSGLQTAPNSARAWNHYASYLRDEAEKIKPQNPQKALELFSKAVTHYQKATQIYPKYAEALYNAGVCYYGMAQPDQAKQQYQKVLALEPKHEGALNNLGVLAFNQNDLATALQYWQQLYAANPKNASAIGNIGAVYHNQNDLPNAVAYYEKALALEPTPNIINNIIKAYNGMGNTAKAQEWQAKAAQLNRK
jgi:tetratricopeptide (TPR) repeat protein